MSPSTWFRVGAILGFLGVAAGTFGAHGLESLFRESSEEIQVSSQLVSPERRLENFKTGVHYHQIHAVALLGLGLAAARSGRSGRAASLAGWSFLWGIVLFSGSLYGIGVTGLRWLGMIAPIGGVAYMVGWIALASLAWPPSDRAQATN